MNILTLDLATKTGWASIDGTGTRASGAIDLKPREAKAGKPAVAPTLSKRDGRILREGRPAIEPIVAEPPQARFGKLLEWIDDKARNGDGFDLLVTEAPLQHHASAKAAEIAFGLAGVARAWAWSTHTKHVEIDPYELQRFAVGRKADAKQNEMWQAALARGIYSGQDDNEADAIWLLEWALKFQVPLMEARA